MGREKKQEPEAGGSEDFRRWRCPDEPRGLMWEVRYRPLDQDERVVLAVPSRIEGAVRELADKLAVEGGAILSVSPLQPQNNPEGIG